MSPKYVVLRRSAKMDLVRHFRWLEQEVGADTAERFLAAADHSFTQLLATPHIGSEVESLNIDLTQLRKWRIASFPNMRFFYLPRQDAIQIIRVLPASADWQSIFDAD